MKPVLSTEAISRLHAIGERASRDLVLGQATQHVSPDQFERVVREAVISLKDALTRIENEPDPLTRHLGFRALARDVSDAGIETQRLSQPDEQMYVRSLVQDVLGRESISLGQLDPSARADLEVLLRYEKTVFEKQHATEQRDVAQKQYTSIREAMERAQRDIERHTRSLAVLPENPRPFWLRLSGIALAVLSLGSLGLLVEQIRLRQPRLTAPWNWTWALAAIGLTALGVWLFVDPTARKGWLVSRLQQLRDSLRTAAERENLSKEAMSRALDLFERVNAECREEEEAALAVLKRRPGARRYVSVIGRT